MSKRELTISSPGTFDSAVAYVEQCPQLTPPMFSVTSLTAIIPPKVNLRDMLQIVAQHLGYGE